MVSKRSLLHCLVLVCLLALVTACTRATPRPKRGTPTHVAQPVTPQPTLPPGVTSTPSPAPTATPQPTPTPSAGPISTPTAAPEPTLPPSPAPSGASATSTLTASPAATPITFPPAIGLEPALGGFQHPVYLTHAGEESQLFIVEQVGHVLLIEDGLLQSAPFLDITDRVGSQGREQGLLSIAFPPDGTASPAPSGASGLFYANYTDQPRPKRGQRGATVIARYHLLEGNPRQADPASPASGGASEQIILQIAQPASNHNGGQLQFGPDGYLYIGMGDGGPRLGRGGQAGDPWGNGQNPDTLLGKMLRLDVTGADTYNIPDDNPFVGQERVRPEIWALGLRNPWRFAFDRATGDLHIADVGQNRYEEVNFQPAGSPGGENYGWDVMEGQHCFEPESGCDPGGLALPITEYDRSAGCSVTGGTVYQGSRYPQMGGVYFFGDFCTGNIWGLRQEPSGEWAMALHRCQHLLQSSFGEDTAGEIYVDGYGDGIVYRLIALS